MISSVTKKKFEKSCTKQIRKTFQFKRSETLRNQECIPLYTLSLYRDTLTYVAHLVYLE